MRFLGLGVGDDLANLQFCVSVRKKSLFLVLLHKRLSVRQKSPDSPPPKSYIHNLSNFCVMSARIHPKEERSEDVMSNLLLASVNSATFSRTSSL